MSEFNIIMSTNESTVVSEYTPEHKKSDTYQSEAALEKEFIRMLCEQGYEYITIHNEKQLTDNLRKQLENLNNYTFTDSEWERFFATSIASTNDGILEKTRKIQEDYIQVLIRDDGTQKNIYLLDKKKIHNNSMQVINQYEENEGTHNTRYDVTVLVNGLPLVHIELKRRGVAIREAFNQIKRYQRDSFWAASGLYEYHLPLTFENKSNESFIVGAGYGTMNGEKVWIDCIPESGKEEFGYEFVVMPNETITETFQVAYAQTRIRDINKVKTIEANFTLYKIDFSEKILNTGNVVINVKQ